MANENAVASLGGIDNAESFDFDELEAKLQNDLDSQLAELEFLKEDRKKIGNPESLGNTIKDVVWEQFMNQMATIAGEDFIKENQGLTLDLRDKAHIQNAENFANGKIAAHNDRIDFPQKYDDWQDNFQRDDNGMIRVVDKYQTGNYQEVIKPEARDPYDKNRDKGSATVHKDHVVPVAEIIRDPAANAFLEKKERVDFANGSTNLQDLDAAANQAKGDRPMGEWLDSERNGQRPAARFNINEEELRERDRVAREEFEKRKAEGERKAIEAGKQSQKAEMFRITGKALRAAIMQLLAELVKEVVGKLILWFKKAQKNLETLIDHLIAAIHSFISKLHLHLLNAGNALITTIATAILGPIVRTIKKVWTMLKVGWKSLKEAITFLKSPENKNKPFGRVILETGKIVTAGLSAAGAIVLGEVIEKGLMAVPVFAFEIPILGSLASLIGLFMGGLIAGLVGAIAINLIDKIVVNQRRAEADKGLIEQGNIVLCTQIESIDLNQEKLKQTKESVMSSIKDNHERGANTVGKIFDDIIHGSKSDVEVVVSGNEKKFKNMNESLDDFLK